MANKITPRTFNTLASLEIVHPEIRRAILDVLTLDFKSCTNQEKTRQGIDWAKKIYHVLSEVIREVKATRFEEPNGFIEDIVTHNASKQRLKRALKAVANAMLEQINELYRHLGRQKVKEGANV